jgi:predicted Zn finger-like uncharacterized protein
MQLTCPHCGFSREIPDEKIPPKATVATCPKCHQKFTFRQAENDPIDILFDDVKREEDTVSPIAAPPVEEVRETPHRHASQRTDELDLPWESLETYGLVQGFYQTIMRVMKSPVRLFSSMPLGRGIGRPLLFYLILAEIEILFQFMWGMAGITGGMQTEGTLLEGMGVSSVMILVFYPFFLTLGVFLGTAVVHVSLKVVRGATAGFEATFRALTYGSAPMILSIFPLIGPIVGAVWALATTLIAYKHVHRTTYPKVVLAILLPAVLILTAALLLGTTTGNGG